MLTPGDWVRLRDETMYDYPWDEIGQVVEIDTAHLMARVRFTNDQDEPAHQPWISAFDLVLIGHG